MDGSEDSSDDNSSDEEEEEEEEYIPAAAAAAAPSSKARSKKSSASLVAPPPTKVTNNQQQQQQTSKKGASDPLRKNHLATADTQTVLNLLPSTIRPPGECDLRSYTLGELRRMEVDPATARPGTYLTLIGVHNQALNARATKPKGGVGQLFQQSFTVGSHSFTLRREATARSSFQKRESHGRILKGILRPNVHREQAPVSLLMSAVDGVVLLNVSANLSKHLRTGAFPAQIRAQRGNEARPLAQVPYGVGQGEGSEICTLTLVYASSCTSVDVSFKRCVKFCKHVRITAGPLAVLPAQAPLPCGCEEQPAIDGVNVREWFSPVVDGRILGPEANPKPYPLRMFQEGAKDQEHNIDAVEEAPAQAQPVSPRSPTPLLGAKQKKRSAAVSVDVPTLPSSAASSPASSVSDAAASSSSFSTPPRSKRARLSSSPGSAPSVSTASTLASSSSPVHMEDEQDEETMEQYAAAAAAALSSPPPLSPSASVSDLASETDQAPYQPDDGLPASPVLRQPSSPIVPHPIDLAAMRDDATLCAYSSPIPFASAAAASPVRSSSRPSFLQSARALSFDLRVVASPMIGPQNADSVQGTSAPLLLSPNMHAHYSRSLSPLASPLSQPPQQSAPFRASDDGACMGGPMQPMFGWNGAAAAFPAPVNLGPMHPNAFFA
jgi:hypothetical protein